MAAGDKSSRPQSTDSTGKPHPKRTSSGLLNVSIALFLGAIALWRWLPPSAPPPLILEGYDKCRPEYFDQLSSIPATKRISLTASPVYNATQAPTMWSIADFGSVSFCNVSYTYTHPGYGDRINVQIYLPSRSEWNGRFQGVGGGGFLTSLGDLALLPAVSYGYAAAGTDGGFMDSDYPLGDPSGWATTAEGLINWNNLAIFGPLAIYDMTRIGQTVTKHYYETKSTGHRMRSYYHGCSTGGRQGLMAAQRYPELYDGLIATAPAVDYPPLFLADTYSQHLMTRANAFPQPCELEYITTSAIAACDSQDGVADGLISNPEQCTFDPISLVDSTIPCPASPTGTTTLSAFAAHLALQFWSGPHTLSGHSIHPGFSHEASFFSLAGTTCDYTNSSAADPAPNCHPSPWNLVTHYLNNFVLLNPPAPNAPATQLPNFTTPEFLSLYARARVQLSSAISAASPDLSLFSRAPLRPKMITWHGLADELIAANHSLEYYKSVRAHFRDNRADYSDEVSDVRDFYRYYSVPGVRHCGWGAGPYPGTCFDGNLQGDRQGNALEELVRWVEEGVAPGMLRGVSDVREDLLAEMESGGEDEGEKEAWDGRIRRPICAWPGRAEWKGGNDGKGKWWDEEGWECVEGNEEGW